MLLSIVVPCMNEEEVLRETNHRLISTLEGISLNFEIVYVDDGSTDSTTEFLRDLQAHDARIRVVRFAREGAGPLLVELLSDWGHAR
jgi:dolichol-phosphate mannosyltransferase